MKMSDLPASPFKRNCHTPIPPSRFRHDLTHWLGAFLLIFAFFSEAHSAVFHYTNDDGIGATSFGSQLYNRDIPIGVAGTIHSIDLMTSVWPAGVLVAFYRNDNVVGDDWLLYGTSGDIVRWRTITLTVPLTFTVGDTFGFFASSLASPREYESGILSGGGRGDAIYRYDLVDRDGGDCQTGQDGITICPDGPPPTSPIPIPSSITLFAAGLFGIGFVRRRRA